MVSELFDPILLKLFGYLGFVFRGFSRSVSNSSHLISVSINKIRNLSLQDSLFQGGSSFRVSSGPFHCHPIFDRVADLCLVGIVWMLRVCCC